MSPSPISGLVAVPCYNEAGNLPRVIESLRARIPAENLLFIDDGSSDGTHACIERAGLSYLRHPINLGYEEALRTGMRHVLRNDFEYVVFFDGDGQHRVEDLERIVRSYEASPQDLIIGSRYQGEKATWSLRSVGTRSMSRLTTLLSGVEITDVTNGLKLIARRFIPVALKLPTEDLHAELIVGLSRCGARIREEKITVLPRETGESMYHLYKGLFYPAKTMICLIGEMIFYRGQRAEPPAEVEPGSVRKGEST
jgi:glycosyltransferase involved in cell wall biosynthesis